MLAHPFRVAVAVASLCLAVPTAAHATHWWWPATPGQGQPVHLNKGRTPAISFWNRATGAAATPLEHARGEWSKDPAFDLYNWASWSADVIAWDGAWGNGVGWAGLASSVNYDGTHAGHFEVQVNTSSGWGNAYYPMRALACQEIGHAVGGMLHAGPGCMGFSYQGISPAASNNYNDLAVRLPSAHDREHTAFLWNGGFH